MSKERESGFYWVRYCGDRIIAEWLDFFGDWHIAGSGVSALSADLDEIDERRIVREE
ncbi:MAG: hypothetical protein ACRCXB_15085 [Aeromonadaceae bacterium]